VLRRAKRPRFPRVGDLGGAPICRRNRLPLRIGPGRYVRGGPDDGSARQEAGELSETAAGNRLSTDCASIKDAAASAGIGERSYIDGSWLSEQRTPMQPPTTR
jgi:hypothetical protein